MKVKLSSCPNPDHGQTKAPARSKTVKVESLEEASRVCRTYIEENMLGAGNWAGGQVYEGEERVAYISYNGRIWEKGSEYYR